MTEQCGKPLESLVSEVIHVSGAVRFHVRIAACCVWPSGHVRRLARGAFDRFSGVGAEDGAARGADAADVSLRQHNIYVVMPVRVQSVRQRELYGNRSCPRR